MVHLAWRCGVDVSPPFYWPWHARLLLQGLPCGIMIFAILLGLDVFIRRDVWVPGWYFAASGVAGIVACLLYSLVLYGYRFRLRTMPPWHRL